MPSESVPIIVSVRYCYLKSNAVKTGSYFLSVINAEFFIMKSDVSL